MRRCIFVILFMFLLSSTAKGQNSVVDSLEVELSTVKQEKRIPLLLELAKVTRSKQSSESIRYANEALELLAIFPNVKSEAEALYQKGWANIYQRDYQSALENARKLESIGNVNNLKTGLAKSYLLKGRIAREQEDFGLSISVLDSALVFSGDPTEETLKLEILNELGSVYRRQGSNEKALDYHSEALEICRELNDKVSISTTLGYIGIIQDIMGHYDQALKTQQETLELRRELDDRRGLAAAITNIGILHQKIGNYDDAMNFYDQAQVIWLELDREPEQAATYNNMGAVQDLLGKDEEALKYYQRALDIWEKYGDSQSVAIALSNIGAIKVHQGSYEEALDFHKQALEIRQTLGDQFGSADSYIDIAELYEKQGQVNLALEAAHEGLALAEETGSWPLIRDAHEILSEFYETSQQYDQALIHFKAYKTANDTIFNIDSQSVIAELQQQYKTKEQQQQIAALEQREKYQSLRFSILAGGTIFIGIVLVLIYSRYRFKKKAHLALEQLHEKEIEKAKLEREKAEATANYLHAENERKSQELEAARQLQLSMLPSKIPEAPQVAISAHMKTAVEVGGDYYDFDVAEDGTLTFAIGDATGHGVKAGTMVTATKSLFNLLAGEKELPKILQQCSKAIKKMKLSKLYMALALVRLRGNTLELAGAGMPPALVYRADTGNVEKIALKGMPLGSVSNFPYTLKTIKLRHDDVVLLCTDGFPELFNANGKMLGYDMMPKILAEVGSKSTNEIIDHFRSAASEWAGDEGQQDDMTFIVLKSKVVREHAVEVSRE